ncbi:tetratricopeptide repeat protein [Candidatus Magnetaquicoccus inordinatus]|uniref:tetratricopeptide repeat protein n=1 Tax=Candidatus Magnetaquicoccus inordinatus TaxID=2496818 RepID=UPI00102B78A0|nr:hypothetical protein [Candidatus Magnetaquicoccus inordinatus]
MHVIPSELPPPKNEADFERMCANIYGVVYGDPTPKINGRKGQSQGGVDIFVTAKIGRIGIQCKKYFLTQIEWKHVEEEVAKSDKFETPIKRLLMATTSQNDAALLKKVQLLSDEREEAGKFGVEIEFWEDIQLRIDSHTILQDSYRPQSPGAAYHRQSEEMARIAEYVMETREHVATMAALPQGREDSANKLITGQLDRTNELIKAGRYRDALEHIDNIGRDLAPFDDHQRARWYLQRGLSLWYSKDDQKEAAELFVKASKTYPDDERMAAAGIRGLSISEEIEGAIAAGREAAERFPLSIHVWLAYANARIISGEQINSSDVPPTFQDEPDTLQLAAFSAKRRDNVSEAARLAGRAAEHESAGFFIRAAFLRFAVEDCAAEPVLAQFGLMEAEKKGRLEKAVSHFDDRQVRLWSIQSDACVETATHLGFAFLLLGQTPRALEISQEARSRRLRSPELLRVEIQALDESGRKEEALAMARSLMSDLSPEALAITAGIASNQGDVAFLEEVAQVALRNFPGNIELGDFLLGLKWVAMARSGKMEDALGAIQSSTQGVFDRPFPLSIAARILKRAERAIEAMEMVDKAVARLGSDSKAPDRLQVAELLSLFERWTEAASLYEGILAGAGKGPSELHAKLLECYVESENRSQARDLLSRMPEGWVDHDETRRCAINLGQRAGDWQFLLPLAERQVAKAPTEAVSWWFKLKVLMHAASPAAFQSQVEMVPEEVSGSICNIGMLASLELRYGQGEKALRRLYCLARRNMDEPEAFSAYLINLLIGKTPPLDDSLKQVAPGCVVTITDESGSIRESIVLDPLETGHLPKRDGFFSPDDPDVLMLIGKGLGAEVVIPWQAGGSRLVRITSVGSAYRHMVAVAQERAGRFNGIPHLKPVQVGNTGNLEADLARVHEEIRRVSAVSKQVMEYYASGAMTLSLFAELLGRSPIDLCMGWSSDLPPLFVGEGHAQERAFALAALRKTDLIVVADSTALCELARHGAERALSILPRVLIASATKELVDAFVTDAESDKSSGMAFDNGGKLGFVEYGESWKAQRIAFARRMAEIVAGCDVLPVYGDFGSSEQELFSVLGTEEGEILRLAKEHGASILTLDGRLRKLARSDFGIEGLWPQVLVMRASEIGLLSQRERSAFTIGAFLSNRTFVSLASEDLLWMVAQGDAWLQSGMSVFKHYLSSANAERDSTFKVTLDFLLGVVHFHPQTGAFAVLLSHVAEAMFRRADCPVDWGKRLEHFVWELLVNPAPPEYTLSVLNDIENHKLNVKMKLLSKAINDALVRSKEASSNRPLRIRVLHCALEPYLVVDRDAVSEATQALLGEKVGGEQNTCRLRRWMNTRE